MEGKKNCGAQLYSFTLKRDNYSLLYITPSTKKRSELVYDIL